MKIKFYIKKNYSTYSCNQKDLIKNLKSTSVNLRDINNTNYLYFLGGFVEGEGSNTVSITVNKNFKYGISIKPEFNVTQHKNGIDLLLSFKELFGAGSVVLKSGSEDVYVYVVKGISIMSEKIIPFLTTYVQPFSGKKNEFELFTKIVKMSAEGGQSNKESLIEMIKLIYAFDKNKVGKGKTRKRDLNEILEIINDKNKYFDAKNNSL
jgi:hypothetical protein